MEDQYALLLEVFAQISLVSLSLFVFCLLLLKKRGRGERLFFWFFFFSLLSLSLSLLSSFFFPPFHLGMLFFLLLFLYFCFFCFFSAECEIIFGYFCLHVCSFISAYSVKHITRLHFK
jgi:drug/metabolite transporter (DMT)-like permease